MIQLDYDTLRNLHAFVSEALLYIPLGMYEYTEAQHFLEKVMTVTTILDVEDEDVYALSFFEDKKESIVWSEEGNDGNTEHYRPFESQKVTLYDHQKNTQTIYDSQKIIPRGFIPLRKFYKSSLVKELSRLMLYFYFFRKVPRSTPSTSFTIYKLIKYYKLMTKNMMKDGE